MPRTSVMSKDYGKSKQQAAAAAVARARTTILNARRSYSSAPPATRGFYGGYTQRGRDELKTIDTTGVATNVSSAGTVVLLNGVSQGTDYTNRIGRKIRMKSILYKTTILQLATVSNPTGTIVRVMLIYDNQTNASAPTVTDVLLTAEVDSPLNLTNRDRFRVLTDKWVHMPACNYAAGALTTGNTTPKMVKIYKKLNHDVIFGSTGATVGSIQTGGLFELIIGNQNALVTSDLYCRTRFTDN